MSEHKYFDDGGPAFPVPEQNRLSDGTCCNEGMTLRDWFAGQALIGMTDALVRIGVRHPHAHQLEEIAKNSFAAADAMIAARKAGA